MVRGDLDILKDWCHEAPYNLISQPLTQAKKLGYYLDSKILGKFDTFFFLSVTIHNEFFFNNIPDIENVDLAMGKVMEQGPVLIITFQSQQIMCVRNSKNEIVEGDPEKVMRVNYVWVLCRDPSEMNPKAAWRLLDLSANSAEQFV